VEEGEKEWRKKEVRGGWNIGFWNVAGVKNKDEEFWGFLREWEVIILMETWLEKSGWGGIKGKLPKGYVWGAQWARRESKKGRAKGGMLLGIRKECIEKGRGIEMEEEGIMVGRVKMGEQRWRIVGVYASENIRETLKKLERWTEEKEKGVISMIGGDFNARTGGEGGGVTLEGETDKERENEGKRIRKSKDRKINKEGRLLAEFVEERGWGILNGCTMGDDEGEFTFTGGKGNTVIDYVMGDEEMREKVINLKIGERIESDHQPVVVRVEGVKRSRGSERRGIRRRMRRGIWNEEGREVYRRKMLETGWEKGGVRIVGDKMERRIKDIIEEVENEVGGGKQEKRGWWDGECRDKKEEVRRELRKWRKRGGGGEDYKKRKKEYKELCLRKKQEENERWEKRIKEVKREGEVWEIINRERGRRGRINEGIAMEEWKEYFMGVLGGVEGRVVLGGGRERGKRRKGREMKKKEYQ